MKHLKKDLSKFKDLTFGGKLYVITAIVTVFVFSLLAVSSVFLQKELRKSQDLRKEAWNEDGVVELYAHPGKNFGFDNNKSAQIDFQLNTHGLAVNSAQLSFKLVRTSGDTGSIFSYDLLQLKTNESAYTIVKKKIEQCSDANECFEIKALVTNKNPLQPIVSDQLKTIFSLEFLPQVAQKSNFSLIFDDESYAVRDEDFQDQLIPEEDYTFNVTTSNQVCTTPQGFDATSLNCGENQQADVNFSWLPPVEVGEAEDTYYTFQLANDPDFGLNGYSQLTTYSANANEFGLENLDNGTWYARVRVGTSQSCLAPSDWSEIKEFSVDCPGLPQCSIPNNLTLEYASCTDNNLGNITLTWQDIDPETTDISYELRLSRNSNLSNASYVTLEESSYSSETLDSGDWYAQVRVNDADSCQPNENWSTTLQFNIDCVQDQACEYIYHNNWGECIEGWQEQTYEVIGENCENPTWSNWHRPCMMQCQYKCDAWGECPDDNIQTRECRAINKPCWDYIEDNYGETYVEEQYCEVDDYNDLKFDSYEDCWFGNSNGLSTYITWSSQDYSQVSWIDVSNNKDFTNFAHKNVEGAQIIEDGYKITDGLGFKWAGTDDDLYFKPETVYYARLYYSTDGESFGHSRTVSFRQTQCKDADAGTSLCNESCENNNDCTQGLFCHEGSCRLPQNPESEICVDLDSLRGCAEWCADDNECQDQYICWYNYCRNPNNVDITVTDETSISLSLDRARETSCVDWDYETKDEYQYVYYTPATYTPVQLTTTSYDAEFTKGGEIIYTSATDDYEIVGCNQFCQSNRNCESNHRCYQGKCRLAANPESPSCSTTKGGLAEKNDIEPTIPPANDGSSDSAEVSEEDGVDSNSNISDSNADEDGSQDAQDIAAETAWDALKQYLESKNLSLPLLIGAGLAGLILLIGLISLLSGSGKKKRPAQNLADLEKNQFKNLQSKPSSKQSKQASKQSKQAAGNAATIKSAPTIKSLDQSNEKPKQNNIAPPPSSMINRLKDKEIKKPKK
ncbi:MAG: hypothetical protein U9O78_03275 [Patescibacteria group bacterium]|nr:hypothetical protein [Patescibacteria group bacterium]